MSTPSNAVSDSTLQAHAIAPADIPATQRLYWSVRRELWESRSIYIAPLAVAAVFLVGFLISLLHLPGKMRTAVALDPAQQRSIIEQPYDFAALLLMGTMLLVGIFYSLDALHGERRDRSILFWKSLPVSDVITVLSKAAIPVVLLPVLTFSITFATHCIMLVLSSLFLLGSTVGVAPLWMNLSLGHMWLSLLYHLLAIHGFWYAPIFAWLLLVSAWARRATFLWAALPLVAIAAIERIAFNTSQFATMLGNRLGGPAAGPSTPGSLSMDAMTHGNLADLLSAPGLWIGFALSAIFLAAAIRLRRYQGPI